jgi:hypothetical protein
MTLMLTPAFDVAQVDKEHSDRELPRKQVFLMCGPSTFYLLPSTNRFFSSGKTTAGSNFLASSISIMA